MAATLILGGAAFSTEHIVLSGVLALLLPIGAILNFTLHELGKIRNTNTYRVLTSIPLGYQIALSITMICSQDHTAQMVGIGAIAWVIALEFIVVIILNHYKKLDSYIKEYEDGLFK